jgi:threonine/homoserine/homoserine lactone efflux protein
VRRYRPLASFPLSLVVGVLAGFLGAIPPGPLNVTCLRKALQGRRRDAYRVAAGGAIIDTFVCALIGLGLGWILEKVVTNAVVRTGLALFLVGYGLKLLVVDVKRDAERSVAFRRMPDFRLIPSRGTTRGRRPRRAGSARF